MIQNPRVGGVVIEELFVGNEEDSLSILVGNYRFLLVLYSYYDHTGTDFMQVGHVPIDKIKMDGSIFIGYDGSDTNLLSASYANEEVTFSPAYNVVIYAVYGIV